MNHGAVRSDSQIKAKGGGLDGDQTSPLEIPPTGQLCSLHRHASQPHTCMLLKPCVFELNTAEWLKVSVAESGLDLAAHPPPSGFFTLEASIERQTSLGAADPER